MTTKQILDEMGYTEQPWSAYRKAEKAEAMDALICGLLLTALVPITYIVLAYLDAIING